MTKETKNFLKMMLSMVLLLLVNAGYFLLFPVFYTTTASLLPAIINTIAVISIKGVIYDE